MCVCFNSISVIIVREKVRYRKRMLMHMLPMFCGAVEKYKLPEERVLPAVYVVLIPERRS